MAQTRTHWTAAKIVDAIRALRDAGVVPATKYVVKLHPALYGAAQRLLGGWRSALITAGLDPLEVAAASRRVAGNRRTKWTHAAILSALRKRNAAGKGLDVTALRADRFGSLLTAARRVFGSYGQAVEAAGFKYSDARLIGPEWSPERVLDAIRALDAEGLAVNASAAQHAQSSLLTAAIKYFGTWDAALRAAGFNPQDVRLDINTEAGKGRVFENLCDALFSVIRPSWRLDYRYDTEDGPLLPDAYDPSRNEWIDFKLAAWGMSVASSVRKYSPFASSLRFITLYGERLSEAKISYQPVFDYECEATTPELRELFDTMRQLAAGSVPPTRLAIWSRVWTAEKIIEFIRGLPGDQLYSQYAQQHFRREYSAAVKQFGGWSAALKAAGFAADSIKRRRDPYTKGDIDRFVRERAAAGDRLDAGHITASPAGNGLYQAAGRIYGDWSAALSANGVNPNVVSGQALSKQATLDRLLHFIQGRHAAGEPLNAEFIRDNFAAEYANALRLAGGWRRAVARAGIAYETVSKNSPPQRITKAEVDQYILARRRAGLPLTATAICKDNRPMLTAIQRKFYGSWKAALEANGIEYRDPRKKPAHGQRT